MSRTINTIIKRFLEDNMDKNQLQQNLKNVNIKIEQAEKRKRQLEQDLLQKTPDGWAVIEGKVYPLVMGVELQLSVAVALLMSFDGSLIWTCTVLIDQGCGNTYSSNFPEVYSLKPNTTIKIKNGYRISFALDLATAKSMVRQYKKRDHR